MISYRKNKAVSKHIFLTKKNMFQTTFSPFKIQIAPFLEKKMKRKSSNMKTVSISSVKGLSTENKEILKSIRSKEMFIVD